jgi:hypothetical protein
MSNKPKAADQPLLCVVHIPKTAGSAIRETLISILGWEKVYWIAHKRPFEHWVNSTGSEFDDYAVVGGHANAAAFHKIKRPKIFLSVIRDPVSRAISLFNYITRGPDPNQGLRKELQGLSLVEAVRTSANLRRHVKNRQCAFIGGQPTFPAALRGLCDRQWFIDRHEAVDELFPRVCMRFGWPARPLVLDNVGREGYADEHLSDQDTITALKEINQEDSRLVSIFDKEVVPRSLASGATSFPPANGAYSAVTAPYGS